MSEKIRFEVQVETPKSRRGWLAVGGRDDHVNVDENTRIYTRVRTVERAHAAIKLLEADDAANWIKRNYRVVKVTVVTTYEIVE